MKNGFLFIFLLILTVSYVYGDVISSSVMASGSWYKVLIDRDGIYRITYAELRNLGIADPVNVRIYGTGGAMLPEKADENFGNDVKEIPIWMHTGTDGVFNDGDYILFYGQGPAVWRYNIEKQTFEHSLHLWDNQSCYFITSQAGGKRIVTEVLPQSTPQQTLTSFDEHLYYEKELLNLLKSGRYWYGEDFYHTVARQFLFTVPDIDCNAPLRMDVSFMAKSSMLAYLEVKYEGQQVANQPLPIATSEYQEALETTFTTAAFNPLSDNVSIELTLDENSNGYARGWLNYLRLFARRKLNISSSQLFFRDIQSVGAGKVTGYQITNCTANTRVWDITDMHHIKQMNISLSGSTVSFSAETDNLREFVAFDMSTGLLRPTFPDNNYIENQNLHAINDVDMVIVTHPDFVDASRNLAKLHEEKDGLLVEVVTTAQVYNEFSSGMQDPAAIRNFMKLLYEKMPTPRIKYLLLMGDGSYDNKSNQISNGKTMTNTNFVVTYQSVNSDHRTNSYVSDDFFGILGDEEPVETGDLKIGVGRIPVQTPEQAQEAVNKIRTYIDTNTAGDWPISMGLLADDEDNNLHALQSENLADYVDSYHPQYTIDKLYFDAFPQVATVDGHRYPEVEQRLNDLLNKGCLLVNYIGHGNETGLAAERVVNTTSISHWKNKIYPLFVVATCEFGRYDDDVRMTTGESILLSPQNGGIALLTSTRLVYSSLNFEFNSKLFHELFTRPVVGDEHRLGDILRRAKNSSNPSVNKLCFTLLGDPALNPIIPANSIQTTALNGKLVTEPMDTLKANSRVTIHGSVTGQEGQTLTDFNGVVYCSLFDKARELNTYNNDGSTAPITFTTQTSLLHKGKAAVKNGEFEMSFVMPRDINYQYGFGKISYYACSDDGPAAGAFKKITVGGGAYPKEHDGTGPTIRLFMNDTLFRDGGMTDQNPRLIAFLEDTNGINTSDEGIGHQITATLNDAAIYYLNPYYETDLDNHYRGVVTYQFSSLPVGDYGLSFTALDLDNNPSTANIRFRVTKSNVLQIDKLYNYPNPFTTDTRIYFEYNMPDEEIQVELQIFDMSGRQLASMKQSLSSPGYTSGQFQWNGYDANGNKMQAGIYLCRVILRSRTGQTVWQTMKMVIDQG